MSTKSFAYTGAAQPFTVPPGVTSIKMVCTGAGSQGQSVGAVATGTYPVTPGEVLQVNVGGAGPSASSGGWNGGATGGSSAAAYAGYGGAGATDVRRGGTALTNRIIVAGGAGGAGDGTGGSSANPKGGAAGANGQSSSDGQGGFHGTQTAGGLGGSSGSRTAGSNGSLGSGGQGGAASGSAFAGGGGGGGGYYGGGGGQVDSVTNGSAAGGGGSSYTGAGTSVSTAPSSNYGNGSVVFTYLIPFGQPSPTSPSSGAGTDENASTLFQWTQGTAGETYDTIASVDLQFYNTVTGQTETVTLSGNVISYTAAANHFVAGDLYQWRVRDNSSSTGNGAWSAYSTFTPQVNTISAPTLQAPTSGQSVDGTQVIAFHWANGTVTESGDTITSTVLSFIQNYKVIKTVTITGTATEYDAPANTFPSNQDTTWSVHNVGSKSGAGSESNTSDFTPTQTYYAPHAPTLTSPTAASTNDATQPITFGMTYSSVDGSSQSAYTLRLKVGTAAYWYRADTQTLVTTETWNPLTTPVVPGGTLTVTIPAGLLTNGSTVKWSSASQSASGGELLDGPYAADVQFTTQSGPSVTVTNPVGVVGQTQPSTAWTETLTNGVQTNYEVIWERGGFGSIPGAGTQLADTGVVASAATSVQSPVVLPVSTPLRTFVRITQTGGLQSPWGYKDFQTTAPPPPQAFVEVAPATQSTGLPVARLTLMLAPFTDGSGATETYTLSDAQATDNGDGTFTSQSATDNGDGTFTVAAATAISYTYEVQRSDDNGRTWTDVLGSEAVAPDASGRTTTDDVTVGFGGSPEWRARTVDSTGTGAVSDWSTAVSQPIYAASPWLLDPADPTTAMPTAVAVFGDYTYDIDEDVLPTLGDAEPMIESDVLQTATGSLQWLTRTPVERDTLKGLIAQRSTLLQRTRNEDAYTGEVLYFRPVGALTVARVGQQLKPGRLISTSYSERTGPV